MPYMSEQSKYNAEEIIRIAYKKTGLTPELNHKVRAVWEGDGLWYVTITSKRVYECSFFCRKDTAQWSLTLDEGDL